MKSTGQRKSEHTCSHYLQIFGLLALFSLLQAAPLQAADYSLSGESRTILRMRTTTDNRDNYPLYEYLNLNLSSKVVDGTSIALYLGAWGRFDLADKTANKYTNEDLQYGFISYRKNKNNLVANLGRQFISEGVANEKVDGLYLRSDFIAGSSVATFVGSPVLTETNYIGADLVYGARISHSMPKYYTIGLSALKNEATSSSRYREEQGIDLWVHPGQKIDLAGRSSYNSITNDWMEHSYVLTLSPLGNLKVGANITNINYRDYLFNVTTKALSLTSGVINPDESFIAAGAWVSYTLFKYLTFKADYKNYNYDIAGDADFVGGKVSVSLPGAAVIGAGYHRMEGESNRLRYSEYRLYALKKMGHLDFSVDFIDINYDKSINGVRDSFALTGTAGYEFTEQLRMGVDLEYARNPDYYREGRGLVKLIYAFDTKHGEGRGKSEK